MKKERWFNLFLSIGAVLVFLILAETGVRIYTAVSKNFDIEMLQYAKKLKRKSRIPGLSHEHIPGAEAEIMRARIKINSSGFRGPEIAVEKAPNEYRILVLGSSITIGWGVPYENVFTTLLEKQLNSETPLPPGKQVVVINSGIANYNTTLEAIYLKRKLYRFQPDTVILHYFPNDAEILSPQGAGFFIRHSQLVALLFNRIKQAIETRKNQYKNIGQYYRQLYSPTSPGWQETQKAILDIADYCQQSHMNFFVLLQPDLHDLSATGLSAQCQETIKQFLSRNHIGFHDLLPAFRNKWGSNPRAIWVNPDDSHPNTSGHRLMFQELVDYLKPTLY